MRITDRPANTSIWNKDEGWTCDEFPQLKETEVALVVHVRSGIPQYQLESKLESIGFIAEYYRLGKNEVNHSKGSALLYLIQTYSSYADTAKGMALLESVGIPISAVAVITSKLQQSILA
ncbi:MAG TPA: hypothetical protein V6D33_12225 [Cyanophyceae cyanobacterium]